MDKTTKIILIVAASLTIIGSIIFCGAMSALKWDFSKLSTVSYETRQYEIRENYKNITIITDTADILFVPSENSETRVECFEQQNVAHQVTVKEDTLVISVEDTRKWYEYIGIGLKIQKITVYIPQGPHGALSIKSSTGDVEIPRDFTFKSIDVVEDTGDVRNFAPAAEYICIKTSTGDIYTENVFAGEISLAVSTGKVTASGLTCDGDVTVKVSTGKTNITDVECRNFISIGSTGGLAMKNVLASEKFSIERDTGNVIFDGCDAADIFVETDTGDVKGTLLTEKVFLVETDTGNVDVPRTTTGGRCEITTDTGDIKISVS